MWTSATPLPLKGWPTSCGECQTGHTAFDGSNGFPEVPAGSETEMHCKPDELDARTNTELAVGIARVRFDRTLADEQTVADFTCRRALDML